MTHRVHVLLELSSNDPLLDPEKISMSTAAEVARLRVAVLRALPKRVERVIAVLHPELSKLIFTTHELAAQIIGEPGVRRPPPDYVPPTRD